MSFQYRNPPRRCQGRRLNLTAMEASAPATKSATQLTHDGTTQPAITASHCHTKRAAWSAATTANTPPAIRRNVR